LTTFWKYRSWNKILSNLIENALKFTTKGYVEFGVCDSEKGRVCFYVKDTGIGISPENMEKIFHRFSQEHDDISAKYGGLGLGLCIAKENTTLLGGIIRVESTKTIGTTFYVDIPAKVEQIDPKNSEL
jgi:signal transduction histidine kinase